MPAVHATAPPLTADCAHAAASAPPIAAARQKSLPHECESLHSFMQYDPETGIFKRLKTTGPWPSQQIGAVVGVLRRTDGYIQIKWLGKTFTAQRLAYFYMTGELTARGIHVDHINGVRDDNRWSNLRAVTHQMNMQNQRGARVSKRSGTPWGVSKEYGRYRARIRLDGRLLSVGRFDTQEEAYAAYLAAKKRLHPGFVGPAS